MLATTVCCVHTLLHVPGVTHLNLEGTTDLDLEGTACTSTSSTFEFSSLWSYIRFGWTVWYTRCFTHMSACFTCVTSSLDQQSVLACGRKKGFVGAPCNNCQNIFWGTVNLLRKVSNKVHTLLIEDFRKINAQGVQNKVQGRAWTFPKIDQRPPTPLIFSRKSHQ